MSVGPYHTLTPVPTCGECHSSNDYVRLISYNKPQANYALGTMIIHKSVVWLNLPIMFNIHPEVVR